MAGREASGSARPLHWLSFWCLHPAHLKRKKKKKWLVQNHLVCWPTYFCRFSSNYFNIFRDKPSKRRTLEFPAIKHEGHAPLKDDMSQKFLKKFAQKEIDLTLFLSGQGHYGPSHHEQSRCFCRVRATTTKTHDFVSFYVWMVPWKSFLGFIFKIFEK